MTASIRIDRYNTVTGGHSSARLPHFYASPQAAHEAVEDFQDMGGEWGDHENINSEPIHMVYTVVIHRGE